MFPEITSSVFALIYALQTTNLLKSRTVCLLNIHLLRFSLVYAFPNTNLSVSTLSNCIYVLIHSTYKRSSGIFRKFGAYNCIDYSLKIIYTVVITNTYVNQKLSTTGSRYLHLEDSKHNALPHTTSERSKQDYLAHNMFTVNNTSISMATVTKRFRRSPLVRHHKLACCNKRSDIK